jgi:hypothetical protein
VIRLRFSHIHYANSCRYVMADGVMSLTFRIPGFIGSTAAEQAEVIINIFFIRLFEFLTVSTAHESQ